MCYMNKQRSNTPGLFRLKYIFDLIFLFFIKSLILLTIQRATTNLMLRS